MSDVTEVNVKTGEVITRAYTQEELDARNNAVVPEAVITVNESVENYTQLRQSALSKLQALGLTEEEAKALTI